MTPDDHRQTELSKADNLAEDIARELIARGIPVVAASGFEGGRKVGLAFQLENARARYAVRMPIREANTEAFQRAYELVA